MTKRSEKKAKINQALDEIATACIALTQSEGYNTKENLQLVINHCKNYKIHKIQRVAIKSLDRVFVDILPSYIPYSLLTFSAIQPVLFDKRQNQLCRHKQDECPTCLHRYPIL